MKTLVAIPSSIATLPSRWFTTGHGSACPAIDPAHLPPRRTSSCGTIGKARCSRKTFFVISLARVGAIVLITPGPRATMKFP